MDLLNYIFPVLFLGGMGIFGIRLSRNQSSTLVLQKFHLTVEPEDSPAPTVEIVGRMQGLVAFMQSSMGFSPISRFTIAGPEVRYQSSSLFGQRSQFIPLRCVTTLTAGVHKPIANLILALAFSGMGCYLSVVNLHWAPLAIGLLIGIILFAFYLITKKFFIEVHSQGGPPISLLFKPNVLEGVAIDVDQALEVVGVIRDLIVLEGTGRTPKPRAQGAPRHVEPNFHYDDGEEISEDSFEPEEAVAEDDETQARHWYAQARKYSDAGQPHLAIATLKQLVQRFPNTTASEQARKSLDKFARS
jgi:hypothetical protein